MLWFIFKDSLSTIINAKTYHFSIWLVVVCITTIVVKLCLYFYTKKVAIKYDSILVKANAKDHLIDVIITSANLISCLLAEKNYYFLDGTVGIKIDDWIIYASLDIFHESNNFLMDK